MYGHVIDVEPENAGHSIAVYRPGSTKQKTKASKLITDRRADFIAPANYSKGKQLDKIIHAIIDKIAAGTAVSALVRK